MGQPPVHFVGIPVELLVMAPAKRDGVFIRNLPGHGLRLGKSEVMGIDRAAPTDKTGLAAHKAEMRRAAAACLLGHGHIPGVCRR